jgi:hypothetical protein
MKTQRGRKRIILLDTRRGEGVVIKATLRPLYPREKETIPIVWEAEWAPRPVWTGTENLAPHRYSISGPSSPWRTLLLLADTLVTRKWASIRVNKKHYPNCAPYVALQCFQPYITSMCVHQQWHKSIRRVINVFSNVKRTFFKWLNRFYFRSNEIMQFILRS